MKEPLTKVHTSLTDHFCLIFLKVALQEVFHSIITGTATPYTKMMRIHPSLSDHFFLNLSFHASMEQKVLEILQTSTLWNNWHTLKTIFFIWAKNMGQMTIGNEVCNEPLTVKQWSRIHRDGLSYFRHFFLFKIWNAHWLMHIQQHQTCYVVLTEMIFGDTFSE